MNIWRSRLIAAAQAVLAAGALVGMIVAVPIVVVTWVGNPLPHSVPSVEELRRALLTGDVGSDVLIKAVASIVLLLWLQIVVVVSAEVVATVRRRPAVHVPGMAGIQPLVARLVTSMLISAAALAGAGPVAAEVAASVGANPSVAVPPTAGASARAPIQDDASAVVREYEVLARDTLWSIAERELGDPLRWREIAELNQDRVQPDGTRFRSAGLIRPGWLLRLPVDVPVVSGPAPVAVDADAPRERLTTVAAGDSLWSIAERELGGGERWVELFDANEDRVQPDGRALIDADQIDIGWQLVVPSPLIQVAGEPTIAEPTVVAARSTSDTAPVVSVVPTTTAVTETAIPVTTSAPNTTGQPEPSTTQAKPATTNRETRSGSTTRNVVAASLLLGAGLALLDRARRRAARRRLPGRRPPRPLPHRVEAELLVRAAHDDHATQQLRDAMAAIPMRALKRARPLAWFVSPSGVEIQMDAMCPDLGPELSRCTSATRWRRTATEYIEGPVGAPALVGVGSNDEGALFLDLEACGAVSVVGDDEGVAELLRSILVTMSGSPLGASVETMTSPSSATVSDDEGWLRVVKSLRAHGSSCAAALDESKTSSTFAARRRGDRDWAPLVLVAQDSIPDHIAEELVRIGGEGGAGVAVVGRSLAGAGWEIVIGEDRSVSVARLEWAGALPPRSIIEAVDTIATATGEQNGDSESDKVSEPREVSEPGAVIDLTEPEPAPEIGVLSIDRAPKFDGRSEFPRFDVEVEVRLLGDVEVVGDGVVLDPRSTEFVALLACHPDGAREERIKTALWPDAIPAPSSWTNRVSKVRKGLGVDRNGDLHLPHIAPGGKYGLGSNVSSDVARLRALVDAADHAAPVDALEMLEIGLAGIRGLPFGCVRGYDWAYALGFAAEAEALVVDAAHNAASRALDLGDPARALRACEAAARAVPLSEVIGRDRMIAYDAAGDPSGVEAVMRDLCAALETDDPESDLHPETIATYERVGRRRRSAVQ